MRSTECPLILASNFRLYNRLGPFIGLLCILCITSNLMRLVRVNDRGSDVIEALSTQRRGATMPEECRQSPEVVERQSENGDLRQSSSLAVSRRRHDSPQSIERVVELAGTRAFARRRRHVRSSSQRSSTGVRGRATPSSRRAAFRDRLAAVATGIIVIVIISWWWWWWWGWWHRRRRSYIHIIRVTFH